MMRFKDKRSKITSMQGRNQQGMASIVVVSVLIIIMTLISIGFARLINRSAVNSANKQFSASATYAAQSAINDVASYLKKYAQANPGSNFLPKSTKCNGPGSLIGSSATPGPFYNVSNLSGDSSRSTQYTCLLLDPTPTSLVYSQVAELKSQVVKVNTSASTGALDKLLISWEPSCDPGTVPTCPTGYPVSTTNFNDETTWNSVSAACKDGGADARCVPLLRLAIYPISNSTTLSSVQSKSKTVYLYPQSPSGNVLKRSFTDNTNFKDGSIIPVPCTQSIGASDFNPSTSTGYKCNIILGALSSAISPAATDSVYLRMTPIYNPADIRIAANDKFGNQLNFIHDQAVIDATAQTGGVVKRLQARVDTSSLDSSSSNIDTNISSLSDRIPEQAVRTANALCKREVMTTSSVDFNKFVNFDAPDNVCHFETDTVTNPVPRLTLTITGQNGKDNGLPLDSEANNPDTPQNPVQQGTVYVGTSPGSSGTARINWNTVDASSCTATGGSAGWAGEKNGMMTFTGTPKINGSANQSFSVNTVTSYSLQCSRPFAPSPTPVKTVTIWPYPQVTGLSSSSVRAGKDYTVSWTSINAKPNGCVLSGGGWSNSSNTNNNDSETMNWPVNDNSSDRVFTVTCYDPIGRSDSRTIHVNPSGSGTGGGGATVAPPYCSASVTTSGSSTENAQISWSTSCPDWDPANPCEASRHIDTNAPSSSPGYFNGIGSPCWQASGTMRITTAGTYTLTASVWAVPWANQSNADSTGCSSNCDGAARSSATITVVEPLKISSFYTDGVWDHGAGGTCDFKDPTDPNHLLNDTWQCRFNNKTVGGGTLGCGQPPPNQNHKWTTCGVHWTTSGGGGTVSCQAGVIGYGWSGWGSTTMANGTSSWSGGGVNSHSTGTEGWTGGGLVTGYLRLECRDSYGQSASASA